MLSRRGRTAIAACFPYYVLLANVSSNFWGYVKPVGWNLLTHDYTIEIVHLILQKMKLVERSNKLWQEKMTPHFLLVVNVLLNTKTPREKMTGLWDVDCKWLTFLNCKMNVYSFRVLAPLILAWTKQLVWQITRTATITAHVLSDMLGSTVK